MFDRINIGAQPVPRNTCQLLRTKYVFDRQLFGLVDPAPHGGLGDAECIGHRLLCFERRKDCAKGFKACGNRRVWVHIRRRISVLIVCQ